MKKLHFGISGAVPAGEELREFVPQLLIEATQDIAQGALAGAVRVGNIDGEFQTYDWSIREVPTDPLETAEYMSTKSDKLPSGMYLALFHGRKDSNADMKSWGANGPMIPIEGFHTTYKYNMRFRFANEEQASEFAKKTGNDAGADDVWADVQMKEDLIHYDGVFYGDWCVFNHVQAI